MRFLALLAAVSIPAALWATLPVPSRGASPADLQRKADAIRSELERKRGDERVLTSDVERWSRQIRDLEQRIGGLRRRESVLRSDLEAERAELASVQMRLRRERARLTRLRRRLAQTREMLSRRLVEIYQADRPDAVTVVLNSDGFAELLERGEFIRRIAEQDRRIVILVARAKRDAEAAERRLDELERRQQQVTATIAARRDEVVDVKQTLIGTRVGYERTRRVKARALDSIRVSRRGLEAELVTTEREQQRVRARLAAAARPAAPAPSGAPAVPIRRGSGQLIWPVRGAITSPFGPRWGRLHAGVDIPAPEGTPIRAADGGRVAIAGWMGGYGNYTCVQHTSALSTCYAHQSRLGTSVGASVTQGQVIGYVGNTGNSFGSHLHFEVRSGGSPVDPMGYL